MAADKNWNHEPFVTARELFLMLPIERRWFEKQPHLWRWDRKADVLRNLAHPSNARFEIETLIADAVRA